MKGSATPKALLTVADKSGIESIATALADRGVALYSTGGTAKHLRGFGFDVHDIADLTGHPSLLGGRVKALHPAIFAGLLALDEDRAEMAQLGYAAFDYLIAGIMPLATDAADLSGMDIGGPAMIRAAVKTHARLVLATGPADYAQIIAALREDGHVNAQVRRALAVRAMERLARHEAAVLRHLRSGGTAYDVPAVRATLPLRYGENPHQSGVLHLTSPAVCSAATAEQLQGKSPSFTNILDADAAFELVRRFARPAAVIVKHGAPCGVALAESTEVAYQRALAADPQSAFGGIVAFNRAIDAAAMTLVSERFTEQVIAPVFDTGAREVAQKRPAMRVLQVGDTRDRAGQLDLRGVTGGILVQDSDQRHVGAEDLRIVSQRSPTQNEVDDLLFALEVSRWVKSNAVVTARDSATVGIGGGQSSRVAAVQLAVKHRATHDEAETGLVLASDSYFPFPDSVEIAAKAGVRAIVHQGGARRDAEAVAVADAHGIAMAVCDVRLFRH